MSLCLQSVASKETICPYLPELGDDDEMRMTIELEGTLEKFFDTQGTQRYDPMTLCSSTPERLAPAKIKSVSFANGS